MHIHLAPPLSYHQQGKRPYQEDARYPDTDRPGTDRPAFFIVCDGVGGQDKGEVASRTVCDTFGYLLEGDPNPRPDDPMSSIRLILLPEKPQHFKILFGHVYDQFRRVARLQCPTMATTLTFLSFHEGGYIAAHCGDSRIYHIRPGHGIVYQSEDHSLVQELVRNGVITPAEAVNHPQGNIITRCIMLPQGDADPDAEPNVTLHLSSDVQAGDYFLLCTDGVVHEASEAFILSLLADTGLTDEQKLSQLARQTAGSSDNNTAYLVHVDGVEDPAPLSTTTVDTATVCGDIPVPPQFDRAPAPDPSATQDIKPRTPNAPPSLLARMMSWFR